jgi:hypothetical protein
VNNVYVAFESDAIIQHGFTGEIEQAAHSVRGFIMTHDPSQVRLFFNRESRVAITVGMVGSSITNHFGLFVDDVVDNGDVQRIRV